MRYFSKEKKKEKKKRKEKKRKEEYKVTIECELPSCCQCLSKVTNNDSQKKKK